MGIELSSSVASSDVDFGEIASASNLDIIRGLEAVKIVKFRSFTQIRHSQVGGFKGAIYEQPSSSSGHGTVRDNNLFHVSYNTFWVGRPIRWQISLYWNHGASSDSHTPKRRNPSQS